jgi:2-C-methyl-D-erythritol 2,4-cyclodiphosphate synthase
MPKIGFGYDIHRLETGRRLFLGGVAVPYGAGLLGHSDGDALIHALIDALLGAHGQGDIGAHFPDTDPRFKGVSSLVLLETIMGHLRTHGASVVNVDTVIVAEEPKMGPYIPAMKAALAPLLGVPESAVGIKAKTNEGLGPVGEKRAIACYAVFLLSVPE